MSQENGGVTHGFTTFGKVVCRAGPAGCSRIIKGSPKGAKNRAVVECIERGETHREIPRTLWEPDPQAVQNRESRWGYENISEVGCRRDQSGWRYALAPMLCVCRGYMCVQFYSLQ